MSILVSHLRGLIFSNLRDNLDPRLRNAMWNVFNSVDSDLDTIGYSIESEPSTVSSPTEEAVEKLDLILSGFDKFSIDSPDEDIPARPVKGELPNNNIVDEELVDVTPPVVLRGPLQMTDDEDEPN